MYRSIDCISSTVYGLFKQASDDQSQSRKKFKCGPRSPYNPTVRTKFTDTGAHISAWPSKGGVIILDSADAIDFEFLGLNPLNPPETKSNDQSAEDEFCQRLLLLGAKWWDSEARYHLVTAIEDEAQGINRGDIIFKLEEQPPPTMREKRLVKVAWPSTGGVWIADFDTTWAGADEEDCLLPDGAEVGFLKMARTMDERSEILRNKFMATFYRDVTEFEGYGFFKCWATKVTGEVGPLLSPKQTYELWNDAYYGRFSKSADANALESQS